MKNYFISYLFLAFLFSFCTFSQKETKKKSAILIRQDSVIAIHDTAMAKMDEIMSLKIQLKKIKDKEQDSLILKSLDSAIYMLTIADKNMMDWMRQFTIQTDSSKNETASLSYLKDQKKQIKIVSNKIFESINYANKIKKNHDE